MIMAVMAATPIVRRACKMCVISCHLHNPVGKGVIIPVIFVGVLKLSDGGQLIVTQLTRGRARI